MSVWGKVGGAAAGLVVGGPVGAVVGAVVGHFVIDREGDPGVTFTIALVALSGKMARADGVVTDRDFDVFRRVFAIPPDEENNVRRIFNMARQDIAGFDHYAQQIAKLLVGNPALLEDVLDGLFEIAKSDGVLHPCEARFLERVAEIFGFAPGEFRRIRASHFAPELTDPYVILGLSYSADEDELKQTYRKLVRENHPDSLMARGVPAEFVKLANDKLAAINSAYEKIRAERGLS
jgi:DnaJ like chaperone protein